MNTDKIKVYLESHKSAWDKLQIERQSKGHKTQTRCVISANSLAKFAECTPEESEDYLNRSDKVEFRYMNAGRRIYEIL